MSSLLLYSSLPCCSLCRDLAMYMRTHMHMRMHVHMHTHTHTHMYMHMHTLTHMQMQMHMHMHMPDHTRAYTRIHTYTHTCTHRGPDLTQSCSTLLRESRSLRLLSTISASMPASLQGCERGFARSPPPGTLLKAVPARILVHFLRALLRRYTKSLCVALSQRL